MTGSGAAGGGDGEGDGATGCGEGDGEGDGAGETGAGDAERTLTLKDFFATCPFERTVITAYTTLSPAPAGMGQTQTTLLALTFAVVTLRVESPTFARQETADAAGSRLRTSVPFRAQPAVVVARRSFPASGRAGAVVGCPRSVSEAGSDAIGMLNGRTTGAPL